MFWIYLLLSNKVILVSKYIKNLRSFNVIGLTPRKSRGIEDGGKCLFKAKRGGHT